MVRLDRLMFVWIALLATSVTSFTGLRSVLGQVSSTTLEAMLGGKEGIVVVVGGTAESHPTILEWLDQTRILLFVQSSSAREIDAWRKVANERQLLGRRIFIEEASLDKLHLTDNLADAIWVAPPWVEVVPKEELLRILRPLAYAQLGEQRLQKPIPPGIDDWSHPYHGPDNNPQSNDQYVRGAFETQFIAEPMFSPMPEQTVIAGGRMFKAMGHIAHKANQNPLLNTLLGINAYNGVILWKRPLPEGFMIHRNTMVATADALYMGDHASCKVIDPKNGNTLREITIPPEITDGPVWKWMAIEGDTLYALVGNLEAEIETLRSDRPGIGHWPWGMWQGFDYKDPKTAFGHGRTLVAIDREQGTIRWHYRSEEFLDARALCMKNQRLYFYAPEKYVACLDARNGELLWQNADSNFLEAMGPNERAQHYITGFSSTCYMKCHDDHLFFAGPQRKRMVVTSTRDGHLEWTNEVGNLQLVLRQDSVYAAGPQATSGMQLDYGTGAILASLPARRACTRATGCVDSIFFRATGGTVRLMTNGNQSHHIAPMRPPCQDGVLISNGHLYWGPWMCGCQLSLYGNIGLKPVDKPATTIEKSMAAWEQESLIVADGNRPLEKLDARPGDWLTFRGDPERSDRSPVVLAERLAPDWKVLVVNQELPTAPVSAGGLAFIADRTGKVQAFDHQGRSRWQFDTGGAIYYPPTIDGQRLYVSSADGRVYALEATSGRLLWSFRVAPADQRIPMYGKLVSRWPVSGGVVVKDGVVYAAAGITHYDGTVVVALDASNGKLLQRNDHSGRLSDVVNSGISLQGELAIVDQELRFAGGGIYELARYDLKTLACLNEVKHNLSSEYRTAFYPWYPSYGKYVSLEQVIDDEGHVLSYDANYDGSAFGRLALEMPRELGVAGKMKKDLAGEFLRRRGQQPPPSHVWVDREDRRFTAFVVTPEILVATGHSANSTDESFLVAISLADGTTRWKHDLPAQAVKGGLAMDAEGRILVSLENGELHAFAPIR